MKTILVDVGSFYTKVCVMRQEPGRAGTVAAEAEYQFYGRGFFPTLARASGELDKGRIYYERAGQWFAVGYDAGSQLRLDEIGAAFDDEAFDANLAEVILRKIVFDYADATDEVDVFVVVDSAQRAQVFEGLAKTLGEGVVEVAAYRGIDGRRITKDVRMRVGVLPSGDAVLGFLDLRGMDVETALVVDVGHNRTKLYVVGGQDGVELFRSASCGVSFYYEKILRLLAEESVGDHHYLWLVKQIELGCDDVEVRRREAGGAASLVDPTAGAGPHRVDVSLVLENVRWDLNKEFTRFTTDSLTAYYTNRVEWPGRLVVMGGGASLNGEMLRLSLEEGGFHFDDVYVERQPMYSVLDGAAYVLGAGQAD
ncbi:MAG: hypothetical protein WCP29_02255 [Acidobacteriota bacterium]